MATFFEVIDKIREVGNIPTLPTVATQVMSLAADPNSNISDIAEVIETDQALATRVLKVVNSSAYAAREKISSIQRAVVHMGLTEIRSITIGLSVMQMFPGRPGLAGFDREAFWNHCLSTGQLAKAMALRLGYNFQGDDYTAGLLHDIGKILLDQYFQDDFVDAIQESRDRGIPLHQAEAKFIGGTHFQVGAWLVKRWRLPPSIYDVVAHHHAPSAAKENREIIAVVFMANILAQAKGLGFGGNIYRVPLDENDGWKIIQQEKPELAEVPFEKFIDDLEDNIEEIRTSGSIF